MKTLITVSQIESWSMKRRFLTFLVIFGAGWGLLEPLFAVMREPGPLGSLGWWRYFIMVFCAIALTFLSELRDRQKHKGNLIFIRFEIVLIESGLHYQVKAPQDMRASDFITIFFQKINNQTSRDSSIAHLSLYSNYLLVDTGTGALQESDPALTLKENNITNGCVCRIGGRISDKHKDIMYIPPINFEQHSSFSQTIKRALSKVLTKK